MSDESGTRAAWWLTRVALPFAALGTLAIALGRSDFDGRSLEPFYDAHRSTFPLRESWFFDGVLHRGGRYLVIAGAAAGLILAAIGLRSARWRPWSGRGAYLAACVALTSAAGAAWKHLAEQVTPWNTARFGGKLPWPADSADASFLDRLGSPGAHAASGFAWVALYFVGASLGARRRAVWLAPGLVLGGLFALAQHARGAHPPSHEPWSLAIAWTVAALAAASFRRLGWMTWSERPDTSSPPDLARERLLASAQPWLIGATGLFAGTAFFALDQLGDDFEDRLVAVHDWVERLEILLMGPGTAVACFLLADKVRAIRERGERRAEAEREQRFQLLGRMAASVAHEVRNPLHSLRLIVDEQRHDVPALARHPLQPEIDVCLERIDRAVELVYRLARPESAVEEDVDLVRTLRESIGSLERASGRAPFDLGACPERAVVRSSPAGLRIVVENLLRNAYEAAEPDERIPVSLQREDADWRLSMRNRGRLSGAARAGAAGGGEPSAKPEGLGLGLSISRQIAGGAGGRIDLAEEDGLVRCDLRWPAAEGAS